MHSKHLKALSFVAALGGLVGCASTDASDPTKPAEAEAPVDGKLDGLTLIEHGPLEFHREDGMLTARPTLIVAVATDNDELNRQRRAHAWEFSLSEEADISLAMTAPSSVTNELDTVMYLYRQSSNGNWGRYIRRNDDDASNTRSPYLSGIDEGGLQSGRYRIVIKGYNRNENGEFGLKAICTGAGCVLATENTCWEDQEVTFVQENPRYEYNDGTPITESVRPNSLLTSQILIAVRNHAALLGDNVTIDSVADAREYVDRGSLQQWSFRDTETERMLTVIDFTMGDTVVGSVFDSGTEHIVATVNDGQFLAADGEELCW